MTHSRTFYVYMTASSARGVIYVGMTSDLLGRAWEHRQRALTGFTHRYWVDRLVYYEHHETAEAAVQREYLMKRWRRDWKIRFIESGNPTWRDLYHQLAQDWGYDPSA